MTTTTTTPPEADYGLREPLDADFAGVLTHLPAEDEAYRQRARAFVQDEVLPVIDGYWDRADYPLHLVRRLGELDLLRDGLEVEGTPPMSHLAACLVHMELARGDGSVATMLAVQGGLAMRSIALLGSEEQRQRWLGPMARGELLGAFALTEPAHGSDSVSLETRATRVPGGVMLNGEKKWIGNGSAGGLTVVWARGEDEEVHGYVVPQESAGYSATTITGKVSQRAIWQAHVRLQDVFVPDDCALPGARTFKDTSRVLRATRLGVAWDALGHATACYEASVYYAKSRIQFGRPLGASQLVQERLARAATDLTSLQATLVAFTALDAAGQLSGPQASMAKYTATRTARRMASDARDLLGGNGILLEHRVGRHFADVEAIHTYEGTESVQALILGRAITGLSAFA
ncbi:acyl-CoA dehydrogenase family protein [Quadrisphaera sp. KR29]|uniref:acyl-CoA dehydrogenase family protein n=1 Tax=Quadrisphaera sp. KR29 TaxID=3461391 RepID=UPI004044125D